ncbi:unnamed protein product [Rotaria sordida]|uniref:Uncharacterized protein n=1 Tax=Rotaria sordida TaxID=392033 RepID=A0A818MGK1_9BILA|nr:unnamed protein product [Rotaria sordida]
MDLNNGWFETLNYPVIDHQQQTYVTKHDLNLLHKKIIATDLIVQKYQDANKALLRLQNENEDLKQQIEQITNECCIFGKQVTECTQEFDNLKEQLEISNSEKRELHQQLRLLQDENTNNYHEIMVLKQYESLKDTNDQLSKTVDRQQKQIAKLQLQVQRKSPIIYKANKDKKEPSETDIALTNSQKSVRELKLALARLMNFIQTSQIEIPTALHIRPVLKAHDINDDFLEIEGEFIRKPVKKVSKPVISQTDDDDDDNGDFIDIRHTIEPQPVNITNSSIDIIEKPSKTSSRQEQKKKEIQKRKSTKKNRRQKDLSTTEKPSTKLDDLANELEIALSQSDQQQQQQNIPQFISCLSDDDDEDKISKSDKQLLPIPMFTPISLQPSTINSTISIIDKPIESISNNISFFSDDENLQETLSPIIEQQSIFNSLINQNTISSLQVDSITPMDIETSYKPTKYMSFLSEDDDDNNNNNNNKSLTSISTSLTEQQSNNQEYISSLDFNQSIINNKLQSSDKQSITHFPTTDVLEQSLSSTEDLSSNRPIETISENIQDSLLNDKHQTTTSSSNIVNILDSNHIQIVLRLLNTLTQIPVPLKPLRLVHRRSQRKKNSEEQASMLIDNKSNDKKEDTTIIQLSEQSTFEQIEQQPKSIVEISTPINDILDNQVSISTEEESKDTVINEIANDQISISMEEHSKSIIENNTTSIHVPENQIFVSMEEEPKDSEESNTVAKNDLVSISMEEQPVTSEESDLVNNEIPKDQVSISTEEHPKSITEDTTTFYEISIPTEQQLEISEESNIVNNEISKDPVSISIEEHPKSITEDTTTFYEISIPTEQQLEISEESNIVNNEISKDQVTVSMKEHPKFTTEDTTTFIHIPESQSSISIEQQPKASEENDTVNNKIPSDQVSILIKEQQKQSIEENYYSQEYNPTINNTHDVQQNSVEENSINEQSTTNEKSSMKVLSQEFEPIIESIKIEQTLPSKNESIKSIPPPVLEIPKQSLLKPFQISIINRLLNTLINLPVKPLILPMPYPLRKRKRKSVVKKLSISRPQTISRSSNRIQTRSLNSIRTCIARCNQPTTVNRKRTATESILSLPPMPKRMKSIRIEQQKKNNNNNNNNEYDLIIKFLNSFSKEINDDLKKFLQQKLHENILLFNDNIYRIFSDLMIYKCDIILSLVKNLHSYEESIKLLLVYIHSQSSVFQQHFITKLKQAFEFEIKQQQISNNRIKILNRLFFLTCSIFPTSSVIIYARLFDIGYYLSHDILIDALTFISNICSSLISIDSQTNSSNILLHRILFDLLQNNKFHISYEYLKNLLITYHKYTHDQEDLIRCFILIFRYQSWSWCSNEFCRKFLIPLLNKIDDNDDDEGDHQYQQRIIILTILQYMLFIYKDNEDFKRDLIFHDQIKQLLLSLKTINSYECTSINKPTGKRFDELPQGLMVEDYTEFVSNTFQLTRGGLNYRTFVRQRNILQDTQRILDLIAKRDLDDDEKKTLIDETVDNFNNYINPGFLQYRKSFSPDYVAVEWADSGSTFTCVKGIEYIDCLGGFGIYNVGHRHPKVVKAVTDQLQRQALHSQELLDPLRGYLAKILAELLPGNLKYAFFTNSGTESVEGALKMAMLATGRRTIIAAIGAFHGKSLGALGATSKAVFRKPFLSSLHNMRHIPFNDLHALEQTLDCLQFTGDDAAAVLLEPILGEGGVIVPNDDYFPGVRRLCDKYGVLLIADEVQTGMGRTGKMFCVEHWNVEPDVICLGKAFGGGVIPAGAFVGSEKLWKPIFSNPFLHTTTFGGNPLACAAAIATINVIFEERLCERARTVGDIFLGKLKSSIKPYTPHIALDARGKGLMLALEFADTDIGFRVAKGVFREKILVAGTLINAKTIRIEPPLTITLEQIDKVINALDKVLKEISNDIKPPLSTNDSNIKTTTMNTLQRTVLSQQL